MRTANTERILQHIRRLASQNESALADSALMHRYLAIGDQAAFTTLVHRHGPMVFAVCQSVLRQRHDAEDACQAVFLILTRKAGSIRQREGLGGWLQLVAYRVALRRERTNCAARPAKRKRRAPR